MYLWFKIILRKWHVSTAKCSTKVKIKGTRTIFITCSKSITQTANATIMSNIFLITLNKYQSCVSITIVDLEHIFFGKEGFNAVILTWYLRTHVELTLATHARRAIISWLIIGSQYFELGVVIQRRFLFSQIIPCCCILRSAIHFDFLLTWCRSSCRYVLLTFYLKPVNPKCLLGCFEL